MWQRKAANATYGKAPDLFAGIPKTVWRREWVSFVKHYGHGNDAVLNYLSRYVFRTANSLPIAKNNNDPLKGVNR